ncbi:hypothetical protein [Streptomyces cadmiisoli]|uniref:hypothetical protein n=1 Tax=Streptomyces cadmiisoli TaxID=2184053 RepID=UPI003D719228
MLRAAHPARSTQHLDMPVLLTGLRGPPGCLLPARSGPSQEAFDLQLADGRRR